jgi:hypothetical protein
MKQIALVMALLPFVVSVTNINPTPAAVSATGCTHELTVTMKAGSLNGISWKAGIYNVYACGSHANLTNSPIRFCTKVSKLQGINVYSCLQS